MLESYALSDSFLATVEIFVEIQGNEYLAWNACLLFFTFAQHLPLMEALCRKQEKKIIYFLSYVFIKYIQSKVRIMLEDFLSTTYILNS